MHNSYRGWVDIFDISQVLDRKFFHLAVILREGYLRCVVEIWTQGRERTYCREK